MKKKKRKKRNHELTYYHHESLIEVSSMNYQLNLYQHKESIDEIISNSGLLIFFDWRAPALLQDWWACSPYISPHYKEEWQITMLLWAPIISWVASQRRKVFKERCKQKAPRQLDSHMFIIPIQRLILFFRAIFVKFVSISSNQTRINWTRTLFFLPFHLF